MTRCVSSGTYTPLTHSPLSVNEVFLWFQVSSDCRYLQTSVVFEVGGEVFACTGKTVVDPGYTAVMSWQAIPPDEDLPSACEVGQTLSIKEVR